MGRLGGLWAPVGAIFGVLERSLGVLGPSLAVSEASWGSLGPTWRPLGPERVTREDAGRREKPQEARGEARENWKFRLWSPERLPRGGGDLRTRPSCQGTAADLGRLLGRIGRSETGAGESLKFFKHITTILFLALSSSPGRPLGALLYRLGSLLCRLEAVLDAS